MRLQLRQLAYLLPFAPLTLGCITSTKQAFEDSKIPSDLNVPFDPSVDLEVSFGTKDSVSLDPVGLTVLQNETGPFPSFGIRADDDAGTGPFVIAAVDPDAPTPQNRTAGPIRHLIAPNYYDVSGCLRNNTPAISGWVQPNPPAGSDPHRYIFFLFNQPEDFETKANELIKPDTSILNFDLSKFVEATGLGAPIGGNFMLVGPGEQAQ